MSDSIVFRIPIDPQLADTSQKHLEETVKRALDEAIKEANADTKAEYDFDLKAEPEVEEDLAESARPLSCLRSCIFSRPGASWPPREEQELRERPL